MTQPQSQIQTPFAPLPVRARGTLEIFDTSFKLFRRYAGVLLAWSFLASVINLVPVLGSFISLFTMPLIYGAVSCAVAAAVRGQNISFKQVWGFTKPRYGALLGVLILAWILLFVVALFAVFAGAMIIGGLAYLASSYGFAMTVVAWILGTLVAVVLGSLALAVCLCWFNLAPVIACLEDANRGSSSLSRGWDLLKGNWRKCSAVATIVGLMGGAAFFILLGFFAFFFYGGWDKMLGASTADSIFSSMALTGFSALFFMFWTPIQTIVGAVFYLDLRTRKEALDLEWTNYAAKPEALPNEATNTAPPAYAPAAPTAMPGMNAPIYTPPSSLGAGGPNPAQAPGFAPTPAPFSQNVVAPVVQPGPPVTADSFADFAAQVETIPAPAASPLREAVTVAEAPKVTSSALVTDATITPAPSFVPAPSPVASENSPVAVTVDGTLLPVSQPTIEPVVEASSPPVTQVPPVDVAPVAPQPIVTQPAPVAPASEPTTQATSEPTPVPAPASNETSSFAPPPRFRRTVTEDDDFPSSFGGGSR